MARAKLTREEAARVIQYTRLTDGILDFDGGKWIIDTPEETNIFRGAADLMEFIDENLESIREAYIRNGESDEWERIAEESANCRFSIRAESDRMYREVE